MIEIVRYAPSFKDKWDEIVEGSRNATFLFKRDFMDYHADRFEDHSLIALRGGKPCALLPANIIVDDAGDKILQSHWGLTYGGWLLTGHHPDASEMLEIFERLKDYAKNENIKALDYKPIPSIYFKSPSQEDLYALFCMGAVITECNISCTIDLNNNPGFNKQQKRNLKRASKYDCVITEDADVSHFYNLLTQCLQQRYGSTPVHTLSELQMLRDRFPNEIRVFTLSVDGEPHAGVCMFEANDVARTQYICSSQFGRDNGLLTMLLHRLIYNDYANKSYFDFGTCNESHGAELNHGLYHQKSSLGGSGVAFLRYRLNF